MIRRRKLMSPLLKVYVILLLIFTAINFGTNSTWLLTTMSAITDHSISCAPHDYVEDFLIISKAMGLYFVTFLAPFLLLVEWKWAIWYNYVVFFILGLTVCIWSDSLRPNEAYISKLTIVLAAVVPYLFLLAAVQKKWQTIGFRGKSILNPQRD